MTDAPKDLSEANDFVNPPDTTTASRVESGKPRSPKSKKARKSGGDKKGKKRSSEEMLSEGHRASGASSRAGLYPAPSAIRSAHPLLAPRSGFMPDQFDAARQGLPRGDTAGAAQVSASVAGSSERLAAVDEEPSAEAFARMSRTERKRYREKKRRSEVNKGFDDLMALLLKVEYVFISL